MRRSLRPWSSSARLCAALVVLGVLMLLTTPAWAQAGRKDDGPVALLLLAPIGLVALPTLQTATLLVFPRFSRRCAATTRRYPWQTGLAGLAGFLGAGILGAAFAGVTKNQQLAVVPLVIGSFLAGMGGVGLSLEVGKWGMRRLGGDTPAHPVVEVLAGVSLVAWGSIVVPFLGVLGWMVASLLAMGAFVMAAVRGSRLDEAQPPVRPPAAGPPPEPTRPPVEEASAAPEAAVPPPAGASPGQSAGPSEQDVF